MHGPRRVITFCLLTAVLPTVLLVIPLYLRHSVYADVSYEVTESDVLKITEGISSIFCQEHSLRMNSTFNAYQLSGEPQLSPIKKHVHMKKSMTLPDDTLEYWGFYLLDGSIMLLSACFKYEGGRVMIVRGERNLRTCGLMDRNMRGKQVHHQLTGEEEVLEKNIVKQIFEKERPVKKDGKIYGILPVPVDKTFLQKQRPPFDEEEIILDEEETIVDGIVGKDAKGGKNDEIRKEERRKGKKVGDSDEYQLEGSGNGDEEEDEDHESTEENKKSWEKEESGMSKEDLRYPKKTSRHLLEFQEPVYNRKHKRHLRSDAGVVSRHRQSVEEKEEKWSLRVEQLKKELGEVRRKKREEVRIVDGGMKHGGTAINFKMRESEEESSFELGLRECYGGDIEFQKEYSSSESCSLNIPSQDADPDKMSEGFRHNITNNGYYYYIFYSDNDLVMNEVHAAFDIYKTVYEYGNNKSENSGVVCLNTTECTFPVGFLSGAIVMVEVPTRDGIDHDVMDEVGGPQGAILISSCHPRMSIYIIFPVAVLFLILGCAFL